MTGQVGPGWFPNEAMNGALHWWDGNAWAPRPGMDPHVRLGQTIGHGYILSWQPPYGWPAPPHPGWFPGPDWTPPAGLPYDSTHRWWQVVRDPVSDRDGAELARDALSAEVRDPDLEGMYVRLAPKVWVAPPNWPAAPTGWFPPAGWRAAPAWGPAPDGWTFEQPDPETVEKNRRLRDWAVSGRAAAVEVLLNRTEDYLAWAVAILDAVRSAERQFTSQGAINRWDTELAGISAHVDQLRQAASVQRTYVLYALAHVGSFDQHFTGVRTSVARAMQATLVSSAAAIFSMSQTMEEVEPTGHLPEDVIPDEQYLPVTHAVAQALALHRIQRELLETDDEDQPDTGGTDWQVAEEVAAAELRARGFPSAQRTPPGADGGFDVEGRGIVAQVKYLAQPVGREVIQRLVGANLHGARMAVFSRSGYTKQAIDYARTAQVALFLIDTTDTSAEPANEIAEVLYG